MKLKKLMFACLSMTLLSGCNFILMAKGIPGSGNAAQESREVGEFHAIAFSGGGTIDFVVSDHASCQLECDDNLLEYIVTEVEDGTLKIHNRENISPKSGLKVTLTSTQLDSLEIAGACKGTIRKLDTSTMSIETAGSSNLTFDGKADQLDIEIAGSGTVDTSGLASNDVIISIAGSGDVTVEANDSLDVSIAGSGKVRYRGGATVSKSIVGAGSVKKLDSESDSREI